jgi:hypothetical protein
MKISRAVAVVLAATAVFIGFLQFHRHSGPLIAATARSVPVASFDTRSEVLEAANFPLLRHPILSLADFHQTVASDPLLEHFYLENGFDHHCAYFTTLTADTWARVAYRKGDTFYFTKHEQLILAGTRVLASCTSRTLIKAECGNVLILGPEELTPETSALPNGIFPLPSEAELNPLPIAGPWEDEFPASTPPAATVNPSPFIFIPPIIPIFGSSTYLTPTPEPQSLALFSGGIFILLIFYGRKRFPELLSKNRTRSEK